MRAGKFIPANRVLCLCRSALLYSDRMANRLKNETSPYLLQHADNPVDWQPWDDTALAFARDNDKPILLSVGYSACHWCHVMAHESFEDEATAKLMNSLFVNVKVDREERPDIDRIYQLAQQMFTGRAGGWPLTMFLTPSDHLPIFAGTYFPKSANYGMPAFSDVLTRVESYFRTNPDEIAQNGVRLLNAFRNLDTAPTNRGFDRFAIGSEPIAAARRGLGESFDAEFGGFGDAPKFPHPTNLNFLLTVWARSCQLGSDDSGALAVLKKTLDAMALGGLHDHLGGGFFRYSVDRHWAIPHFEKMLYDNAALLGTYSDAYAAIGDALYGQIAGDTADWLLRDMCSPDGAFYATLDADSGGVEGQFYVFTPDEFDYFLDPSHAALAKAHFGLNRPANFEDQAWHLQIDSRESLDRLDANDLQALELARAKLLVARNARLWPGRDDKILVAWNGLAIGALAKSARRLGRADLLGGARAAANFIRHKLWADGRLKATYKDSRARFAGYLDDYAFLLSGLIELLQTDFQADELEFAIGLADAALTHFSAPDGGFFFTADDHETLIYRPKPIADEAIPSGNAVLALALDDLGHLLGEARYLRAGAKALQAALPAIERYPHAHATFLDVLDRQLSPPDLVIVRGDAESLIQWRKPFDQSYVPSRLFFWIENTIDGLPGLIANCPPAAGPVGYVCTGTACSAPITTLDELHSVLSKHTS
jgi:uncharacterized protein YyaL (SSP411 family)